MWYKFQKQGGGEPKAGSLGENMDQFLGFRVD